MMKKNIVRYCLIVCLCSLYACEEQQEDYPVIRIGKGVQIEELSLNRQTEKRLLVFGGNGKYAVQIENSRIATAEMSLDTLKVKGLLEGETYAVLRSHDHRLRFKILVTYPELGISHTEVKLVPKDITHFVSISGGGELTTLEEHDPSDAIDIKWDGATGRLEIIPKYEGEAEVTAISQDGSQRKSIRILVKPEGEIRTPGWYTTRESSYYKLLNNKMVIYRKGVGTWIVNSARPYGGNITTYMGASMKIAPVVRPVQGDSIELNILSYDVATGTRHLTEGKHRLYVEEVRQKEVMLRGRGFKFLLPYEP